MASFDEALNASAIEAEKRIEAEALPVVSGELWTLHNEGVCQALWFRRLKAQKVFDEIEPNTAVGAVQFFLKHRDAGLGGLRRSRHFKMAVQAGADSLRGL